GGMSAVAKKSGVEFTFLPPQRKDGTDQPASEVHGVFFAGCIVYGEPGSVGLAAFDAAGRVLRAGAPRPHRPAPQPHGQAPAQAQMDQSFDDFLGVRSRVPIARLKLFRTEVGKETQEDLRFDDFVFDRPVTCSLRSNECRIETRAGERISGTPLASN